MQQQVAAAIVLGVIIVVLSAYLTVQFSLQRFYSEKWWERKAEAYTEILDALYTLASLDDRELENFYDPEQKRKLSDEALSRYRKVWSTLERVEYIGAFAISGKAWERLKNYRTSIKGIDVQMDLGSIDYFSFIDNRAFLANECLEAIRTLAIKELRVERS